MSDQHASFGAWVQRRRKALDLTQLELAQRVGCALGTIRKIETDERRPSKQVAARLADQLRLPPDQLALFLQAARAEVGVDRLAAPSQRLPVPAAAPALPHTTLTFLFSDIHGSTQLWERHPQAMPHAIARHQALLGQAVTAASGVLFQLLGQAVTAAFASPHQAVSAALAAQRALRAQDWGAIGSLDVRIALHTGVVEQRGRDYFGLPLSRIARLLEAAHGGQILLSLATEQLLREQLPPDLALRDLGVHRLKDLSLPEQIFQLLAPDLPERFAPLQTLEAHRTNLPSQPTSLIGRTHEIAALAGLLRRDDVRLVTLSGPGGTGKTRLGLHLAAELLDAFADGSYLVNLAPISDPSLVATTIAHALGVAEVASTPLEERLRSFLSTKQALLLLDNFEQVLAAAPLVATLLAAAPRLKVLITSRALLHLYGEHEFAVPPLGLPPLAGDPGQAITQYEAVRLFIARAQAAKADFSVTNAEAPAVAEICSRLDGLPLAIELAAARVKYFRPEVLLARLERRLAVLTGGARDLPLRQQTLRNTIEWSYNLLEEGEQRLFRRLGVFVGGWTIAAAAAVSEGEGERGLEVEEGVASLRDKSLLRHEEGPEGEPRYTMLETIGEYASERLEESGEAEALRRRHAQYYLMLAEKSHEDDQRDTELALFDQFELDLDNLRAALDWSHSAESAAEIEVRLAAALVQFWVVRGYAREGWERLKAALVRRNQVTAPVRAAALGVAVLFPVHSAGAPEQVISFVEEGLALNQMLGDTQGIAWALIALGTVVAYQGDYQRAMQLLEQGLALYQALDDIWGISRALFLLGQLAQLQGELERAKALHEQSLSLCRQSIGTAWAIVRRMTSLGEVMLGQGDTIQASALFVESLSLCLNSRDKVDIPMAIAGLAGVARAQGQLDRAARLLGAAKALSDTSGSYRGLAGSLNIDSAIAAVRAELDDATFALMWARGQKMTLEQATAEALGGAG